MRGRAKPPERAAQEAQQEDERACRGTAAQPATHAPQYARNSIYAVTRELKRQQVAQAAQAAAAVEQVLGRQAAVQLVDQILSQVDKVAGMVLTQLQAVAAAEQRQSVGIS